MITAHVPVDTSIAQAIYNLNAEVFAMQQIIITAASNGTPILPDDPYHEAYAKKASDLSNFQKHLVQNYFPELQNTSASWEIESVNDFESTTMVKLTIPDELYPIACGINRIVMIGELAQDTE